METRRQKQKKESSIASRNSGGCSNISASTSSSALYKVVVKEEVEEDVQVKVEVENDSYLYENVEKNKKPKKKVPGKRRKKRVNERERKKFLALQKREKRARMKQIIDGELVEGITEEVRQKAISWFEDRKEKDRKRRELIRKCAKGEPVEGISEKTRQQLADQYEINRERSRRQTMISRKAMSPREKELLRNERNRKTRERRAKIRAAISEGQRDHVELPHVPVKRVKKEAKDDTELAKCKDQWEKDRLRRRRHYEAMMAAKQKALKEGTEEDKKKWEEISVKKYFQRQAYQASMSKERKEAIKRRRKERYKIKAALMTEEDKKRRRAQSKEWRDSLTGEKRKRYYDSVKRAFHKTQEKRKQLLKQNPELMKSEEEKMALARLKAKTETNYKNNLEYFRQKTATETPEARLKRLYKYKINAAKRKLRKELEDNGVPKEVVETKVKAFGDAMWREWEANKADKVLLSEYKPRLKARKPKQRANSVHDSGDIQTNAVFHYESVGAQDTQSHQMVSSSDNSNINESNTVEPVLHSFETYNNAGSPCFMEDMDDAADMEYGPSDSPTRLSTPSPTLPDPQFLCKHCIIPPFPSEDALREHLRTFHFALCFKCPKCREVMLSPQELSEHFKTAHQPAAQPKPNTIPDKLPDKSTPTSVDTAAVSTVRLKHYICMRCPWITSSEASYFETRKELHCHVKTKHKNCFWPCAKCRLLKYSRSSLEVHKKICSL